MDDITQALDRRTFFVTAAVGTGASLAGCSTSGSNEGDGSSSTSGTAQGGYVDGTRLVDGDGNPVGVDAIDAGSGGELTVYPEKEGGGALEEKDVTALLVRFAEDAYVDPTDVDGTIRGYAAYSKVCTHAGCLVSERGGPDGEDFHCPCHGSTFDPRKGAEVVSGPAPRPLPQLPVGLTSDGEFVVATGGFEGAVGP